MVASSRTPADLFYRAELPGLETTVVHTRAPGSLVRPAGRLTIEDPAPSLRPGAAAYVCGPTGFVTHVRSLLEAMGHPPEAIRTEAFGPTDDDAPPEPAPS